MLEHRSIYELDDRARLEARKGKIDRRKNDEMKIVRYDLTEGERYLRLEMCKVEDLLLRLSTTCRRL